MFPTIDNLTDNHSVLSLHKHLVDVGGYVVNKAQPGGQGKGDFFVEYKQQGCYLIVQRERTVMHIVFRFVGLPGEYTSDLLRACIKGHYSLSDHDIDHEVDFLISNWNEVDSLCQQVLSEASSRDFLQMMIDERDRQRWG